MATTWVLTIGDERHEFSREDWMLSEARDVKRWINLTPPEMWQAIGEDDPDAQTALICVLRRRAAGQGDDRWPVDLRFSDVDANYGSMTLTPADDNDGETESDPTSADQ